MKASKLAEMLLRTPDAEVYVQPSDSEYARPINGSPLVRIDDEGSKPVKVLIFNYWGSDYLRVTDLRRPSEKIKQPPIVVTSKTTGRPL